MIHTRDGGRPRLPWRLISMAGSGPIILRAAGRSSVYGSESLRKLFSESVCNDTPQGAGWCSSVGRGVA
jgi:hypothetical protein